MLQKCEQRLLEIQGTQRVSRDDISDPPCCDVTLLFRTFPKLEKPGLATGICFRSDCPMTHAEVLESLATPPPCKQAITRKIA